MFDQKLRDSNVLDIIQKKEFQQIIYISSVDLVTNRSNIQMSNCHTYLKVLVLHSVTILKLLELLE